MKKKHKKAVPALNQKYPPSPSCSCPICRGYCRRPGWWTVSEAARAIEAGLGDRIMLEMSPDLSFGVLSPAFRGCERGFALQEFAAFGCGFLKDGLCELHGTGLEPLECRFCHHTRQGIGQKCHADLERDWNTPVGKALTAAWAARVGLLRQSVSDIAGNEASCAKD